MKLACLQFDVAFNNPSANIDRAIAQLEALKADGVDLAVFPEAFVTGYCVESLDGAKKISIPKNHSELQRLSAAVARLQIGCVVGFAEDLGGELYNSVVLLEPGEAPRYYSKTHLPELGLDKFVRTGNSIPVFETKWGRIGLLICFDLRHPEPMRVLALAGADLVILPTNWPEGAQIAAGPMTITRASENGIFLATCDRVGTENGFSFIGLSKIVSPKGKVLAEAGAGEETIRADIDLIEARAKRNVIIPGKYEITVFDSRRPDLYARLGK
jgi:predicted amidohydrolase